MIGAVNIWDWLAFVIFFTLAIAATYRLPRYWRGEISVIPSMSRWWPFGGPLLRAWERSMPAAFAAGWSLIVAFLTGWLAAVGKRTDSQPLRDLAYVGIAAIAVFFLSLFVVATVVLINRPKFIVPPHLRQQPGAVQEWFRAIL
jgi:hypothetical protein